MLGERRLSGFNSIFAVSSIAMCKKYYLELQKQISAKDSKLVVATIFSFAANEDVGFDGILDDESFDTGALDQSSRDFLQMAIGHYNQVFKTNFDTSSQGFQDYYKDVSSRVKDREIDILLVVNMFLTGFDATTLNTIWVDKNLRMHGLVQAFSRTNRILNTVKVFGNIICFRDLEQSTNEAIALFGDKDATGIVLLKSYQDYYNGYADDNGVYQVGYQQRIAELVSKYPLGVNIVGETNEKGFIKLYGGVLKLRNILHAFDDFVGNEIIRELDFQDYTGRYYDLYDKYRVTNPDKESIKDDIIFEMELVKQVEVNIDYILMLVVKYHTSNCTDKEILISINKAIGSSSQLRSKKELIENFIKLVNVNTQVENDWHDYVKVEKENELSEIIEAQGLKGAEARKLMTNAFRDGYLKTTGTNFDKILPAVSRFSGSRNSKKESIINILTKFFEKYFGA